MMQRVSEQLGMNATVAAAKVLKLASGAKSEYVQLEASKDILDRAGFKPIDRSQALLLLECCWRLPLGANSKSALAPMTVMQWQLKMVLLMKWLKRHCASTTSNCLRR